MRPPWPLAIEVDLMIGTTVSHYTLVERIGKGGMGEVYKAHDFKLDRFVALKFLPQDLGQNEAEKKRLIREAKAASALDHPNICVIHEIDETEDGRMFIAMAYYEGEVLSENLAREQLPIEKIVDLASQILQGLAKAHEHGVIHRDIKSENIVVTKDGVAKIVDFGLAKLTGKTRLTKTGTVMGTTAYMSPEQIHGEEVDHRTDIWAFGVVLYEMLTGELPFRGSYVPTIIYSILNQDPEPIHLYRPDVPENLLHVVDRALKKDAGSRYQSAAELLADLTEDETTAHSVSPLSRTIRSDDLPGQLTNFIGREREAAQVEEILSSSRLVTLTGPGGTGKTRLSLHVANNLREKFARGVSFVALSAINDPSLVAPTIAQALGVKEAGGKRILDALKDHLRDHEKLLLLDNFEHVVAEAPVVTELLRACPKLKILVTSREPLHLSGERRFSVPPLTLPETVGLASAETLSQYEAVKLFTERALAVKPEFRLTDDIAPAVAEICIRLDGLPLAIELSAARVRVLSPRKMLERLSDSLGLLTGGPRDVPERQRTLRAAILWSHDLLETEEKRLFRRLSVFRGGFSFEAAEAVCNSRSDLGVDILQGVTSLVDKNLLQQRDRRGDEPRFQMLETIREFGRECLGDAGEKTALRNAHRDFFLRFSEDAEPYLTGPEQGTYLGRLEREHDNLRAALEWSAEDGNDVEKELRLVGALWRFWLVHGHLSEGRKLLARAMERVDNSAHKELQAKILSGEGTLAHNQGDYDAAASLFERSLILRREMNDKPGIATALNDLGWARWRQCGYDAARDLSQESLALYEELGERRGIASALANLGWVDLFQGDYTTARLRFEKCLALRRELGDERAIAFTLTMLGWTELRHGVYDRASSLLEEAYALFRELGDRQLIAFTRSLMASLAQEQEENDYAAMLIKEECLPPFREIGDKWGIAFALNILAKAVLHQGDLDGAESYLEESLAVRRETKDKWGIAQSLSGLGETATHRGDYDRAARFCKESLSLRNEVGDRVGTAECLEDSALIACGRKHFERAATLFGSAEAFREFISVPLPPRNQSGHDRQVAAARTELDENSFDAAWTRGRAMSLERAVAYALDS